MHLCDNFSFHSSVTFRIEEFERTFASLFHLAQCHIASGLIIRDTDCRESTIDHSPAKRERDKKREEEIALSYSSLFAQYTSVQQINRVIVINRTMSEKIKRRRHDIEDVNQLLQQNIQLASEIHVEVDRCIDPTILRWLVNYDHLTSAQPLSLYFVLITTMAHLSMETTVMQWNRIPRYLNLYSIILGFSGNKLSIQLRIQHVHQYQDQRKVVQYENAENHWKNCTNFWLHITSVIPKHLIRS